MHVRCSVAFIVLFPFTAGAQNQPDIREILNRLEKVEQQNRELMDEVKLLRAKLEGTPTPAPASITAPVEAAAAEPDLSAAPITERVAVLERKVEEHEDTKVGAEHRMPVTLTGTVLFNAFLNGRYSGGNQYPTAAALASAPASDGASMRQTIIGLRYQGPEILGGGKVNGTLYMDLFGGTGTVLNQMLRLRIAAIGVDWKDTSISFGQDKPIVAPREPESLAQMGVSPLTGAGNLWLWLPQVKLEHRFHFGEQAGLRAQVGIFQTNENSTGISTEYRDTQATARPGWEGRFELWKQFSKERRIEIAPGFHASDTHVLGQTAPSRIFTMDWLIRPTRQFDFSGAFFTGENVGPLGALRQGVTVFGDHTVRSIGSSGGWGQLSWRATPRLTFNIYAGQEDDRNRDLVAGNISKNFVYAGNFIYRLGTNILASFEASQSRTIYVGSGLRLNPHYDIALAYLF